MALSKELSRSQQAYDEFQRTLKFGSATVTERSGMREGLVLFTNSRKPDDHRYHIAVEIDDGG